jgi:hypothetical protein
MISPLLKFSVILSTALFFVKKSGLWDGIFQYLTWSILLPIKKVLNYENFSHPRLSPKVMELLPMIISHPSPKLKGRPASAAHSIYNFNKIKKIENEWSFLLKPAEC